MAATRIVHVHLTPEMARAEHLADGVAVVIDVLRATTTIAHAMAAGCKSILPCREVCEAKAAADNMRAGRVLLGGEREGKPLPGFDLGNSPCEYSAKTCKGRTLVYTTSNGTRALHHAAHADLVFTAAFVNFSAVCEHVLHTGRPVHFICAGADGEPALEDTLLAGAFVEFFSEECDVQLNDSARLAWDCFENHGRTLEAALEISDGGGRLIEMGMAGDVKAAAQVDKFTLVPELRREPMRIEIGHIGIRKKHW